MPPFMKGSRADKEIPSFTASIDAAVALAERVLPGWLPSISKSIQRRYWYVELSRVGYGCVKDVDAVHDIPAIALVIAILRAKQAEGKV